MWPRETWNESHFCAIFRAVVCCSLLHSLHATRCVTTLKKALASLVPRRSRRGQSWTLPGAVTSPRDTQTSLGLRGKRERLGTRLGFGYYACHGDIIMLDQFLPWNGDEKVRTSLAILSTSSEMTETFPTLIPKDQSFFKRKWEFVFHPQWLWFSVFSALPSAMLLRPGLIEFAVKPKWNCL